MTGSSIAERMLDLFQRQIEWLEAMEPPSSLPTDEDALDSVLQTESGRTKQLRAFEDELDVLKKEWNAATVSAEERAKVVEVAQRVESLVSTITATVQQAAAESGEKAIVYTS